MLANLANYFYVHRRILTTSFSSGFTVTFSVKNVSSEHAILAKNTVNLI